MADSFFIIKLNSFRTEFYVSISNFNKYKIYGP